MCHLGNKQHTYKFRHLLLPCSPLDICHMQGLAGVQSTYHIIFRLVVVPARTVMS